MKKRYKNALEEYVAQRHYGTVLTPEIIRGLRERECSADREERKKRMIEHGDVDPGYFDR